MKRFRYEQESPTRIKMFRVFSDDATGYEVSSLVLASGGWFLAVTSHWMFDAEELLEISKKISSLNEDE